MKTVPICAGLLFLLQTALAGQDRQPENAPQRAHVGHFKFEIDDTRLPLQEAYANSTQLIPNLTRLYHHVAHYWHTYGNEEVPPVEEQSRNLTVISNSSRFRDHSKYNDGLLIAADEVANASFEEDSRIYGDPNPDVTFYYLEAINNITTQTYYYILGAYIGVGFNIECAEQINEVLTDKDEWAMLGSSAASTLMALLPTFLAFGNLYVPRSSEAYSTSALVGLTTAFFSFGLPTQSISAVKSSNVHTLSVFGLASLAFIARLGKARDRKTKNSNKIGNQGTAEFTDVTREELGSWFRRPDGDEVKAHFARIKDLTNEWDKRLHWWRVPAVAIAVVQIVIFAFAVYPLLQFLGVPKSIFGCRDSSRGFDLTGSYLGASAAVNTVFRYVRWEMGNHERVKVYSLSDSAKSSLREIITADDEGETTASYLPPLLPPYILALRNICRRIVCWRSSPPSSSNSPSISALLKSVRNSVKRRLSYIFQGRNVVNMLRAGFIGDKGSARRWRPVYILIHLSTEARNPFITLLTGFIEAGLLLILTFFFAAQWGGNLFLTMTALVLLLVFVTLGRLLGLFYVWLSSRVWGLTVINCDDVDEIRGVLRIVCSMEGVLVCVNGATYFGGYRMDGREGFDRFLDDYERGYYDEVGGSSETGKSVISIREQAGKLG